MIFTGLQLLSLKKMVKKTQCLWAQVWALHFQKSLLVLGIEQKQYVKKPTKN